MKKTYTELGENSTYTYPSLDVGNIKKVTVSNTISSINFVKGKDNATKDMLLKVDNIGSNVKVIEASAFIGCQNLKSVTINNHPWYIGQDAFKDCPNLSTLEIKKINGIERNAFRGTNIRNLTLDVRSVQEDLSNGYNYEGCYDTSLEDGPYLGSYCFADISNLRSVELCTATQLGDYMFSNCTNLTSVTFANHGQCVGRNVFENCTSLEKIRFPQNFEMYSRQMFKGCSNLSSVSIPESATKFYSVEASAFQDCPKLTAIQFPRSLSTMDDLDSYALSGSNIQRIIFKGISSDILSTYEGVIKSTGVFKPIKEDSNFKYGTWYGKEDLSRSVEQWGTDTEDDKQLKKILSFAKSNFIPLFIIWCSPDCSLCKNLKDLVLKKISFQKWLAKTPYLYYYSVDNTTYKWKLLRSCGFVGKGGLPIPAYLKIWYKEDGTSYKSYDSRKGLCYDSEEYIKNMKSYIPKGFEGYEAKDEFWDKTETFLSSIFRFWGFKDQGVIKSGDNIQYKYSASDNFLIKI